MNKRILLVDISVNGHRLAYIKALRDSNESICLLPVDDAVTFPYVEIKSEFDKKRTIQTYFGFIFEINKLIDEYKISVVHLLCGDALYRFMGIGLNFIKAKTIVTFHHMTFSKIKQMAIKGIFRNVDCGVVHTEYLYEKLHSLKIENVTHIEYPVFSEQLECSKKESREILGLPIEMKILCVMGGTQRYKGLDILLEALNDVNEKFFLVVSGPEREYSKEYIEGKTCKYKEQVKLMLRFLEEKEFQHLINASDFVMLPYRFEFDGASGPLADSTIYRKTVIAAGHGSLGGLVVQNHLGYTFETENVLSLTRTIESALQSEMKWDEVAERYRNSLQVEAFQEKYKNEY